MKPKRLSREGDTRSMTKGLIVEGSKTNNPKPPAPPSPQPEEKLKKNIHTFKHSLEALRIE